MIVVPAALLLLLASTIPAAAAGIAAGCPTACGNISIPYPFGVGLKCSRQGFNLTCDQNHHHQPPKLFLGDGTIQILNISLLRATARIKTKILSTPSLDFNYSWTGLPADGPYTLSVTENQFTAIGCGILANFVFPNSEELISVCASVCVTRRSVPSDGSCSGVGCCRTTVPIGLRSFDIRLRSLNQTPGWAAGFANKVFVVEQEWFRRNSRMLEQKFSPGVDDPSAMDLLAIPAVLDWTLGNSSCREAKNRPDFGCRSANSLCVDSTEYSGYRCNCSDGFRGNPYVLNGCQDVDECEQPETYPCYGICINEMGSYRCICPSGTYGGNPIIGRCFSSKKIFTGSGAVIAGAGIGIGLLALLAGVAFLVYKLKARRVKKLRENFFKRNRGLLLQQLISSNRHIADRMRIFSLKELEKATDNFDKTRILGRGGHGTVYKGILSDQRVVAIKKSKIIVQREIDQFINEVAILSQVNHRNVVQLFGCCLETEVPLLVYEFISNGTLSNHLHVLGARSLSWDYRLRIAAETARALAYLHSAASISVFHRDVKSANILLDGNFTAKVSDFGASRSVPLDLDLTGVATAIHGTYGYLDPEYYHTSRLTEKSDVYSFGVILAELLTRERPISNSSLPTDQNLAARFVWLMRNDRLFEILDQQVVEEGQRVDIEAVAALAEMCLRLRGEERPTMKEVEVELEALGGSRNRARHPWAAQRSEDSQSLLSHVSTEDRAADMTRQYSLENELVLSSLPR